MLATLAAAFVLAQTGTDYRGDLDALLGDIKDNAAYARADGVDLEGIRRFYAPKFEHVSDKKVLLDLLEKVVGELHDFHASLGVNGGSSPRLVPSGTDVWGRWEGDSAVIDQVREGSLAEKAGIKAGDRVEAIGGLAPREAAGKWFGVIGPSKRGWDWALNSALAGRWGADRVWRVNGVDVRLATALAPSSVGRLTVEHRAGGVLYLRVENSLGDDGLISDFDAIAGSMRRAKRIILDLRNTPSGGNSNVARGIMGLFIGRRLAFQRHRVVEATDTVRDWVEYATPRGSVPVKGRLVVEVGRWTGSMGEGLAVGFDGMHRGVVVGSAMAGLRGAVDGFTLPLCGFKVFFPTEEVFHVNGTPRHLWVPKVLVDGAVAGSWDKEVRRVMNGGG